MKRIFDFRYVYARLFVVVTLVFLSLLGWWGIRQNVQAKKQAFIDEEIAKLEQNIEKHLHAITVSLRHVRTYFYRSISGRRSPNQDDFEAYLDSLKVDQMVPGVNSIGFAVYVPHEELKDYEAKLQKVDPDARIFPAEKRPYHLILSFIWPHTHRTSYIGYDLASEGARRSTIESSIEVDEVRMTPPLEFQTPYPDQKHLGFMAVLPVFRDLEVRLQNGTSASQVQGVINITFRAREFFEAILGSPDINSEKIQFSIVVTEDGLEKHLYTRFDIPASAFNEPASVRKEFSPAFSNWSIHARLLPHAFDPFVANLHHIFLAIALLLVGSIWWSLKNTASEMLAEESSRRQLVESERRVKEYSRTLLKLNLSIRNVLSEISLDKILPAVAANIRDGLQAEVTAIYLREDNDEADGETQVRFLLRHRAGTGKPIELVDEVTLQKIWEFSNLRDVIYLSQNGEHLANTHLFVKKGQYQSMVILPFIDQTESVVGFALSVSEREFIDDEFIDSFLTGLVKPIGVALRNSYLFTKAKEAVHSKTAFLANMSHEIRTPLGALVGFSDLLCQEGLDPGYREAIKKNIHRNAGLLTRIIDDILDFSKFELSQPVLSFKSIQLSSLITDVQSVVHMMAQEKGIALRFEILSGLPDTIETDDVRIKQILLNLIGNAIKFTDRGHVVVEVSFDNKTNLLRFKVIDTGSGIPKEVRQRLFQPFSQGDDTNTRKFGGTGLGLVLSRKLAQALGGQVRLVSSEVGQGSVFEFVIPIQMSDVVKEDDGIADEKESGDITNVLAGRRVLLVEDSVDNQEIFSLFLERAGAKVDLAKSGDEALIKAAASDHDIILMDIQLPIVDGKQATRILRRRGWTKPIIALTAHALEEERAAVLEAGCDGQITKPVTGQHLVHAVRKFLEMSEARIGV